MSRRSRDPVEPVATALAYAFLDGSWTPSGLVGRGEHDLGGVRRPWLDAVAAEVLSRHPTPPIDAPRRLAATLAALPAVRSAVDEAVAVRAPIRPRWVVPPTQATRPDARSTPRLDTIDDVARWLSVDVGHLEWFADRRGLQRRAPPGPLHHYRSTWITKRGTPRLLEAPKPQLRLLQRRILRHLLDLVPTHDHVHGFVSGRSALTGARLHVGAEVVIRVDLSEFFAGIPAGRVFAGLRGLGYPEGVAQVLTGVCTHRTPVGVLGAMPPGGTAEDRFRLRDRLRGAHLTQGSPTSPALANLCAARLDRRIAGLARSLGATVTRYADDITLSGGRSLAAGAARVVRCLERIAAEEGFRLNPAKTSIRGKGSRQTVTGVVVNHHPGIARDEVDRLKATLHNAIQQGPASQNRADHPEFRAHLSGRISWVEHVNPAQGARLRALFDQIVW